MQHIVLHSNSLSHDILTCISQIYFERKYLITTNTPFGIHFNDTAHREIRLLRLRFVVVVCGSNPPWCVNDIKLHLCGWPDKKILQSKIKPILPMSTEICGGKQLVANTITTKQNSTFVCYGRAARLLRCSYSCTTSHFSLLCQNNTSPAQPWDQPVNDAGEPQEWWMEVREDKHCCNTYFK